MWTWTHLDAEALQAVHVSFLRIFNCGNGYKSTIYAEFNRFEFIW